MRIHLGVRGRLLLAFFGISGFALLGALTAIYSLDKLGEAVDRITRERVPTALASQELSRQAERIVAGAPALLTVTTEAEHRENSERILAEVDALNALLADLQGDRSGGAAFAAMAPLVEGLRSNLADLNRLVENRLEATDQKTSALRDLLQTQTATERLLAPWILVVEGRSTNGARRSPTPYLLPTTVLPPTARSISRFPGFAHCRRLSCWSYRSQKRCNGPP